MPALVKNLEPTCGQISGRFGLGAGADALVACALHGVGELGRVGGGGLDECHGGIGVVLEFDERCRLVEGDGVLSDGGGRGRVVRDSEGGLASVVLVPRRLAMVATGIPSIASCWNTAMRSLPVSASRWSFSTSC